MTVTRYEVNNRAIHIEDVDDATGEAVIRSIAMMTIASWGELLGITDPIEVLAAIIYVRTHGEPDPDPDTGENAWTPALNALTDAARAEAEPVVEAKGMRLMSAGSPIGVDTLPPVDQARNDTRARLGLPPIPDPDQAAPVMFRAMAATEVENQDAPEDPLSQIMTNLPAGLCDAIVQRQEVIDAQREHFLEQIRPPAILEPGETP